MANASDILVRFGGAVDASFGRSIESIKRGLAGAKDNALSLNGALAGIGVGSVFAAVVSATRDSADAAKQLEAALAATGGAVGFNSDQLIEYANQLQAVTTAEDDAVIKGEAALLKFKNVRGSVYKEAIRLAVDSAAKTGASIEQEAERWGKALNDSRGLRGIEGLTTAQRNLMKATYEAGKMSEYQQMVLDSGAYYKGAADIVNFNDQMTALENAFGNLFEGSGELNGGLTALISTLSDPDVKTGFGNLANGILYVTTKAAESVGWLGNLLAVSGKFIGETAARAMGADARTPEQVVLDNIAQQQKAIGLLIAEADRMAKEGRGVDVNGLMLDVNDPRVKAYSDYLKRRSDDLRYLYEIARKAAEEEQNVAGPDVPGASGKGGDGSSAGGPTADYEKFQESLREKRRAEDDAKLSDAARQAQYEIEIARQVSAEKEALARGAEEAADRAQRKQEEALRRLAESGASRERVDLWSRQVGAPAAESTMEIKAKIVFDKDSQAWIDELERGKTVPVKLQIQEPDQDIPTIMTMGMKGKEGAFVGTVTVGVIPQLMAQQRALDALAEDGLGRAADAAGSRAE